MGSQSLFSTGLTAHISLAPLEDKALNSKAPKGVGTWHKWCPFTLPPPTPAVRTGLHRPQDTEWKHLKGRLPLAQLRGVPCVQGAPPPRRWVSRCESRAFTKHPPLIGLPPILHTDPSSPLSLSLLLLRRHSRSYGCYGD